MKKELIALALWPLLAQFAPVFAQNPAFFKTKSAAPVAICQPNWQSAVGASPAKVAAVDLDNGSFDPSGQPVFFKTRRAASLGGPFVDSLAFACGEVGATVKVVLRVFDIWPGAGAVADTAFAGHFSECQTEVAVVDLKKPDCTVPPPLTISCQSLAGPLPWPGGAVFSDNCGIKGIDTSFEFLPSATDFFGKKYGRARRVFTVKDLAGNSSTAAQELTADYRERFRIAFPDDVATTVCDSTAFGGPATVTTEHCELVQVSHDDWDVPLVPDACYKIIRTHRVVNLATHNPLLPDVAIANPANSTAGPAIWVGADGANLPTWAMADAAAPSTPTVAERTVAFPEPLTGGQLGTPAFTYQQVIKVLDNTPPTVPVLPVYDFCDSSTNAPCAWNSDAAYNPCGITGTWSPTFMTHDLPECKVDLSIAATDACSGDDLNFRWLLFLDLDGNGTLETTISSEIPTWCFGYREDETVMVNGKKCRIGRITRDEECDDPIHQKINYFTLPYGTHKIKWTIEDRCGNDYTVEIPIHVGCKQPIVVCKKYLKINQLVKWSLNGDPSASRTAAQFLTSAEDDKTPFAKLQFALRDTGLNPGTGFPVDAFGKPVKTLSWGCKQLGYRPLQLWVRDADGNCGVCPTAVSVGDLTKLCKDSLVGSPVDRDAEEPEAGGFELFQNQPNPFSEATEIPFFIPEGGAGRLRVFDDFGRVVFEESRVFEAGLNVFSLEKREVPGWSGAGFYQVSTAAGAAVRRLSTAGD